MTQAQPSPQPGQQIVVGQIVYQASHEHGGLVYAATAVPPTAIPQPQPTPVTIRPRPFRQLIGRDAEISWVTDLLQQQIPAEFYSEPGMGKTVLLRHLAYHPIIQQFSDGVVYLVASRDPVEDIICSIYAAFYQSALPHMPTEAELRRSLQAKNALIILDDFDLGREDLDVILNAAPLCTFLVASPNRALWGDGETQALQGLKMAGALALLEREWGRPLSDTERSQAEIICNDLHGHPLRIQQTVTAAREQNLTLQQVINQIEPEANIETLSLPHLRQQLAAAFDEGELQDLSFDLGVDYEDLPAQGKSNKARELLELMTRQGRISDLLAKCTQVRPHLNWGEPTQAFVDASVAELSVNKREILSVLAAFEGQPLSAELISQLVGQKDVSSLLTELEKRGLVQNTQYHLGGSLPHRFRSDIEPMLLFLVEWADAQVAQDALAVIQREAKTLAFLQNWAINNNHPQEALQLARVLDGALALNGRWGLWQRVLLTAQQAAQALGDQTAEAWALNQLGCRALCMDDKKVARTHLEHAKRLNVALGNEAATAVNDHNLGLLRGVPGRAQWTHRLAFILPVVAVLALLAWWLSGRTAVDAPAAPQATATQPVMIVPDDTATATTTAIIPTATTTPLATPTPTFRPTPEPPTDTPLAEGTADVTPTPSPTFTPAFTPTPSATTTPTNTPTRTFFTPTPTSVAAATPVPIAPERGTAQRTNVTFLWRGTLQFGQRYQVRLQHTDSGDTLQSELLSSTSWSTILPAARFGEWRWQVVIVSNGLTRASSDPWHFYLDPFPSSNNPPPLPPPPPAATPTSTPGSNPPIAPTPTNTFVPPQSSPTPTPFAIVITKPIPGLGDG